MHHLLTVLLAASLLSACGGGAGTFRAPDGTKINLSGSPQGWITANTAHGKFTGYNQPNSAYGAWVDNTATVGQLFYQGREATNIPSGSATYVGHVVRIDNSTGDAVQAGTSRLDVNFDRGTVEGVLDINGFGLQAGGSDITLRQGLLNGAKFSGNAEINPTLGSRVQGTYEGALMGDGAKDLAGLADFGSRSELNAAFGGIRY